MERFQSSARLYFKTKIQKGIKEKKMKRILIYPTITSGLYEFGASRLPDGSVCQSASLQFFPTLRRLPGRYTEKRHNLLSKLEAWASQEKVEGERGGRQGRGEKGIAQ